MKTLSFVVVLAAKCITPDCLIIKCKLLQHGGFYIDGPYQNPPIMSHLAKALEFN